MPTSDFFQPLLPYPPAHVLAWAEQETVTGVDLPLAYGWIPDQTTAVIGLSQTVDRDLGSTALQADGIPIVRRPSGGGAVILTAGVYCFGVIAPPDAVGVDHRIHAAFQVLTEPIIELCQALGVAARMAGISDLAAPRCFDIDRQRTLNDASEELEISSLVKIAGCAQMRKRKAILVHGSLLVDVDVSVFERYLPFPAAVPDYRETRDHTSFCASLHDILTEQARVAPSLTAVHSAFQEHCHKRQWEYRNPPTTLSLEAQALHNEKYTRDDWNVYRRRPPKVLD